MAAVTPPRTLHDIFEQDFKPQRETGIPKWRDWWLSRWREQIDYYAAHNWKLIPIQPRGKRPIRSQPNYESHGALGPYLTRDQALSWVSEDFNIAVVAGPSKITWMDIDDIEAVPAWFLHAVNDFLTARTPRGLAIPVQLDTRIRITGHSRLRKKLGLALDTLRHGSTYELVPLSTTCTRDTGAPNHHVNFGRSPCVGGRKHDLRVRQWFDLSKPILTATILRGVLKS